MKRMTLLVVLLLLPIIVAAGEMTVERPEGVESYVYAYGHLLEGDLLITYNGLTPAESDTVRVNGWPLIPTRKHDERSELVSPDFVPRAYLLPDGAKPKDIKQVAYDLARDIPGTKQDQLEEMKAYFDELVTEGVLTSVQIYPGEIEITWAHNGRTEILGPPSSGEPRCNTKGAVIQHVLDELEQAVNSGGAYAFGERYHAKTGVLHTARFLDCLAKVERGEEVTREDVENTSFKNPRFLADMRKMNVGG